MNIGQGVVMAKQISGTGNQQIFVGVVKGSHFVAAGTGGSNQYFIIECVDIDNPTVKIKKSHIAINEIVQFTDKAGDYLDKAKYPTMLDKFNNIVDL